MFWNDPTFTSVLISDSSLKSTYDVLKFYDKLAERLNAGCLKSTYDVLKSMSFSEPPTEPRV